MSATDGPRASRATAGTVQNGARAEQGVPLGGDGIRGTSPVYVDMRVGSLLVAEARRGVVTRMFGVPREDQLVLATMILFAAAATVLAHSLRPAVAGSAREVRALGREVRGAFGARYGH